MKKLLLILMMFCFTITITISQITFQRTYGINGPDYGYSIQQTFDGGYILAGQLSVFNGVYYNAWVIKTNAYGDTTWTRSFGDSVHSVEAFNVYQLSTGEYLVEAEYNQVMGMNIIKLDSTGGLIWSKFYAGSPFGIYGGIDTAVSGGYVFLSRTFDSGNWYGYILHTDANGDSIWGKTFNNPITICNSIKTTINGYVICGSGSSSNDAILMKIDTSGNPLWRKTYGGIAYDEASSLDKTSDGGFIFAGYTTATFAANEDVSLTKTDSQGNLQWTKSYGGPNDDVGFSVKQTPDHGYAICGFWENNNNNPYLYLIKTDTSGNEQWHKTFGNASSLGYSMALTSDGGYAMLGTTLLGGGVSSEFYFVKTDGNGNATSVMDFSNKLFQMYPNPVKDILKISDVGFEINIVEVYNIQGVKALSLSGSLNSVMEIDVSLLINSCYFIRVIGNNKILSGKFIKQN